MANYGHLKGSPYGTSSSYKSNSCCSPQFIEYVLFIFNVILFLSGLIIVLLTLLYGTPQVDIGEKYLSTIRSLIPPTHFVNLIHYSMVVCGFAICTIALINSIASCCTSKKKRRDHSQDIFSEDPLTGSTRISRRPISNIETRRSSSVLLCFFIFALLFLFACQFIIGLFAFISVSPSADGNDEFEASLSENLNTTQLLLERKEDFDVFQQTFKCCGWQTYEDYQSINKSDPVPDTCCKTVTPLCGVRKHPSNIHYDGCAERFGTILKEHLIILGSVAIGFSLVEIFGLIFACCLYVQLAKLG